MPFHEGRGNVKSRGQSKGARSEEVGLSICKAVFVLDTIPRDPFGYTMVEEILARR